MTRSWGWLETFMVNHELSLDVPLPDGVEAGSDENIRRVCEQLGHSYEDVSAAAAASEADESYRANTEAAKAAGVFGAPSFTVGDEVFWGDDRLEDAIAFSRG